MPLNADELVKQRVNELLERVQLRIWEIVDKEFSLENFRVTIPWAALFSWKEWRTIDELKIRDSVIQRIEDTCGAKHWHVNCSEYATTDFRAGFILIPYSLLHVNH